MAERLVNVDRDTPMLLPVDLREWVPGEDLVHFVIEAVDSMQLPSMAVNRRGTGSEQHPPRMMLALLVYCYSMGVFSSRRIERATYLDIAVRYLTGDTHPDHDTICAFRRQNGLAKRQLGEGSFVFYDLTSSYYEGRTCPVARLGCGRDGNKGLQVGRVLNARKAGKHFQTTLGPNRLQWSRRSEQILQEEQPDGMYGRTSSCACWPATWSGTCARP